MPKPTPVYRADILACPLNAGKLQQVRTLVAQLREAAAGEAQIQWLRWFQSRWTGFDTVARKGWTRPWMQDGTLPAIFAQMVMHQVSGALVGHLEIVKNTYTALVSGSSLPAHIRHQLHSINRRGLWFATTPVTLQQEQISPQGKRDKVMVAIAPEVMRLSRTLIRRALARHRRPSFDRFQFQLDQRAAWVQSAHTAKHPDWLMIGLGDYAPRIALPLEAHAAFQQRNEDAAYHQALAKGGHRTPPQTTGAAFLEHLCPMERQQALDRNPYPSRFSVPNTVRLLLDADGQGLRIGVLTDEADHFAHQTATYTPAHPGKVLCLDLGLSTLLATDDGELHGRGWMERLLVLDRRLTSIARHRQRLGLRLTDSARYRKTVQQLRGWLTTEIHRILNRLVQRKRPAVIALEALDFRHPQLSRRLNRLLRNFGQGVLTQKLQELEVRYGIVTERREAAYSSQECHRCHYIDARNRVSQSQFCCQFCGLKQHADVQAARTLVDRRSVSVIGSSPAQRRSLLVERVAAFNQRYTRPRGGPADPRHTNPYFKGWEATVRLPGEGATALSRSSEVRASIHSS